MEQTQPQESFERRHQHSVESIVTLFEWLLVAFILALLFQAFAMQAFQIPTGSMAETLRGAHYKIRCLRCGHTFDVGNNAVSHGRSMCPTCDYVAPAHVLGQTVNGDRIFVLKSVYQFFKPQRWDVVVFKNPTNPTDNYIKRLIALPDETVQLVNGDVFINGQIVRKPPNVQEELWMPIFLQDQQPLDSADHFNSLIEQGLDAQNTFWDLPFANEPNSAWHLQDPTVFQLKPETTGEHTLIYVPSSPNDFRAFYGYNESSGRSYKPIVSDLMIRFYSRCEDPEGYIGASLEKYGILYSARVEFRGAMVFTKTVDGLTTQLRPPMLSGGIKTGQFERFEFAVVDQQLVLRWSDRRFTYDLSNDDTFVPMNAHYEKPPRVCLFAAGAAEVRHIGLFRDTFYMGQEGGALRATQEMPFLLDHDEFFVCGDNCNDSLDGRLWSTAGIGNNDTSYPAGIVPRDYMMGKAVMVYWSQAYQPGRYLPPMVPNLNNLKVIFGGSQTEY